MVADGIFKRVEHRFVTSKSLADVGVNFVGQDLRIRSYAHNAFGGVFRICSKNTSNVHTVGICVLFAIIAQLFGNFATR